MLLAKEVLPDRVGCCGVWGEAGRAVWLCRRLEVAEARLLALAEGESLAMVFWLSSAASPLGSGETG